MSDNEENKVEISDADFEEIFQVVPCRRKPFDWGKPVKNAQPTENFLVSGQNPNALTPENYAAIRGI
jgi:hypothetical protein